MVSLEFKGPGNENTTRPLLSLEHLDQIITLLALYHLLAIPQSYHYEG